MGRNDGSSGSVPAGDRAGRLIRLGPERSRQLNGIYALSSPDPADPGVPNVEHLCRCVLVETVKKKSMRLSDADFEESLAFCLGEVVVLARLYVAAPGRELGPFLYQRLRWRLVDHWRSWYGRDGQKRLPAFLPPEARGDEDDGEWELHSGAFEPSPEELVVAEIPGDDDALRAAAFLGLGPVRDRPRNWVARGKGEPEDGRAAS